MKKKIAIPVDDNGILDAHFGHCAYFAIMNTSGDAILNEDMIVPPKHEPGLLPQWLSEQGVTDIIAGGMGQKAIQLFNQNQVNTLTGAPALSARELAEAFLKGSLMLTGNYCSH